MDSQRRRLSRPYSDRCSNGNRAATTRPARPVGQVDETELPSKRQSTLSWALPEARTLRINRSGEAEHVKEDERSTLDTSTLSFTGRIAAWSARHRWWVVAASVMMLVLAVLASSTFETKLLYDFNGEGEAGVGADLISERFDITTAPTEQLVLSSPSLNASDAVFRATVQGLVEQLRALPRSSRSSAITIPTHLKWYRTTSALCWYRL